MASDSKPIKVIKGRISAGDVVSYENEAPGGIHGFGFAIDKIAIAVKAQGGTAVAWDLDVFGLPEAKGVLPSGAYYGLPWLQPVIADHDTADLDGVVKHYDVATLNTAIFMQSNAVNLGTATHLNFVIVLLGK